MTSGLPAVKSRWYGYGRVNGAAAVQTAVSFATAHDLVIRDNVADTGIVASTGAFWNSPDIWCRRTTPGLDPGALPPNYSTAGPHQDPLRSQSNWVYARVLNNGTIPSLDAWIRISITHWPGLEFTYPASFQPTNGPGDPLPSPMRHGTYFIGEAKISGIAPGADKIINVEWPSGLIPPDVVTTTSGPAHWHPCLLVEVTPHDGPTPTGNHVWDDNNLSQKNISIVGTDVSQNFAIAVVAGNEENMADYLLVEINRGRLPKEVDLIVDLLDPLLYRRLLKFYRNWKLAMPDCREQSETAEAPYHQWMKSYDRQTWKVGFHEGHEVVFLQPLPRVQVPVVCGPGRLSPLIVGGIIGRNAKPGAYEIVIIQRQPKGEISGSATMILKIGK